MAGHSLTPLPSVVEFKLKSAWWSELGWNLTRLGSTDDDENATLRSLAQCNSYYRCSYYFQQVSCGGLACLLRVASSSRERAPATQRHQTSVRWVSNLLCHNPNPSCNICIIINYSLIGRLCVYLKLKNCFVFFDRCFNCIRDLCDVQDGQWSCKNNYPHWSCIEEWSLN